MNNDEIITKANDFYEKLNGQRQEEGHDGLFPGTAYKKTSPPVLLAQGMDDDRVLSELGGM